MIALMVGGVGLLAWGALGRSETFFRCGVAMVVGAKLVGGMDALRHSLDALRVQEAQNACPCVGEEGE